MSDALSLREAAPLAEALPLEVAQWLIQATPSDPDLPELVQLVDRPLWMERAGCRGMGTTPFFVGQGKSLRRARELCGRCSVRVECLEFALADPCLRGYWAGTTEGDRRELRQRRVLIPVGERHRTPD